MKPYFAKYLPVEGEIKRGDKYLHPNGNFQQLSDDVQLSLLPEINEIGKLVKLFLCSRDIQVGDKVFDTYSGLEVKVTEQNFPSNASDFWVRVIGEISPEAVWVKEGDEFNEEDVLRVAHVKWGGWVGLGTEIQKTLELSPCYAEGYVVKCPTCKKFH
jgi:hypothetical protein